MQTAARGVRTKPLREGSKPTGCHGASRQERVVQIATGLLSWFALNARDLPWRRDPQCRDAYAVLVSEVMLQQTQVKTVLPFWDRWMRELPTVKALAEADSDTVHRLWAGLGYYSRARNLHRAAQLILADHGGAVPGTVEELLTLPGVGRYTAGAVASIAYDHSAPILDGNVTRVLSRLFNVRGDVKAPETNAELWSLAQSMVNSAALAARRARVSPPVPRPRSSLNQSLMELGALICLPRDLARCAECPVGNLCLARASGEVATLPHLPPRPKATPRHFYALVVRKGGKVLLSQRKPGTVNAYLWEFPNVELTSGTHPDSALANIEAEIGLRIAAPRPLCVIRHSITRYRITLEAFTATLCSQPSSAGEWFTPCQIALLAMPGAHRKIWQKTCPEPPAALIRPA